MVDVRVKPHENFSNVYWIKFDDRTVKLCTLNLDPGRSVYGEELIQYDKKEYRIWDPFRSKLAATILKKADYIPVYQDDKILYLGAASGTTASHISDIIGSKGELYCIEFSQRAMRELIENVCSKRDNMFPILADARFPEKYGLITGLVDSIYCDIAQPEQAKILVNNAKLFLKKNGGILLVIKSRSIDVTQEPEHIIRNEVKVLKKNGFLIKNSIRLEPFDKDHAMVIAINKKQ
ncbi:fibrillarin-like rRNA/tRNA 2'-O-methyltransferase [[Eubacterium] cellulosolvens]